MDELTFVIWFVVIAIVLFLVVPPVYTAVSPYMDFTITDSLIAVALMFTSLFLLVVLFCISWLLLRFAWGWVRWFVNDVWNALHDFPSQPMSNQLYSEPRQSPDAPVENQGESMGQVIHIPPSLFCRKNHR